MTHPQEQLDFDLDEDLFAFAEVAPVSVSEGEEDLDQVFASFREAPAENLLVVPAAASAQPAASATEPPSASLPPAPAEKHAPVATPVQARPAQPRAAEPVHELAPVARPTRLSKSVVAIALAVTVLNSALALLVMRGNGSGGNPDAPSAPQAQAASSGAHAASPHTRAPELPDPDGLNPLHSHPSLDEARAQISRGEYAAARQRVYALLAIIDRLEDPRRSTLEADCQFLIAQALHLEALARMGGPQ